MGKLTMAMWLALSAAAQTAAAALAVVGGGQPADGAVTTNSVFAAATIEDGIVFSRSATDTHLGVALLPDTRGFLPGTLSILAEAVAGPSNVVTILFGDCNDPALALECDGNWLALPPHTFRDCGSAPACQAVSTNRIELSLRVSGSGMVSPCDARATAGALEQSLSGFHWSGDELPMNWRCVSVNIAGPEARLNWLSFRYLRDWTGMVVR